MKESQLENKTAIATNDYVRMVDENNNSVKIKKDSFMAAIRDALPSIISDGETGGGSVLSIINGALKTRTDANLASVLGVGIPRVRALHINGVGYIVFSVTNKWAPKEIKILFNRYGVDCVITLAWGSNTELAKYSIVSSQLNTEVQGGLKIFCSETNMAIQIVTGDSWAVAEGVSYGAGMTVNKYESYDTTGMTQIL